MAFLTSANDDLIRARIGITSSDKDTIKDVFSDHENRKAKPTVKNTNIDVMVAPAKNPYNRRSSISRPYLSVKWPITRELKRIGGTMKEHARRNSFEVDAVSINVGEKSQMTNTHGNTDTDITRAVNIISCMLAFFTTVNGSSMVFNSLANVKAQTPLPAGASVERGVEVVVTENHRIKAAGRGCSGAACSAFFILWISAFTDIGTTNAIIPSSKSVAIILGGSQSRHLRQTGTFTFRL